MNILQKSITFARDHASSAIFLPTKFLENFDKTSILMQIVLKKTWVGEIGKIYRDLNENLRKNLNLRIKVILVKYSPV